MKDIVKAIKKIDKLYNETDDICKENIRILFQGSEEEKRNFPVEDGKYHEGRRSAFIEVLEVLKEIKLKSKE